MTSAVANAIRDHAIMLNNSRLSKREEVWVRAYCAAQIRGNSHDDSATIADTCLKDFDHRFDSTPAPEEKPATQEPTP